MSIIRSLSDANLTAKERAQIQRELREIQSRLEAAPRPELDAPPAGEDAAPDPEHSN